MSSVMDPSPITCFIDRTVSIEYSILCALSRTPYSQDDSPQTIPSCMDNSLAAAKRASHNQISPHTKRPACTAALHFSSREGGNTGTTSTCVLLPVCFQLPPRYGNSEYERRRPTPLVCSWTGSLAKHRVGHRAWPGRVATEQAWPARVNSPLPSNNSSDPHPALPRPTNCMPPRRPSPRHHLCGTAAALALCCSAYGKRQRAVAISIAIAIGKWQGAGGK